MAFRLTAFDADPDPARSELALLTYLPKNEILKKCTSVLVYLALRPLFLLLEIKRNPVRSGGRPGGGQKDRIACYTQSVYMNHGRLEERITFSGCYNHIFSIERARGLPTRRGSRWCETLFASVSRWFCTDLPLGVGLWVLVST